MRHIWGQLVTVATFTMIGGLAFADQDPFADVKPNSVPENEITPEKGFFSDNFGFRKELMSEFGATDMPMISRYSSRQSVGFETLKKFSTNTRTFAAFDFQGRLVRRDGFTNSPNDMEGMHRRGWYLEYHNAYLDFYNFIDPFLSEYTQSTTIGRFNARLGRFYVPFGLNTQTDTHGTVLQLSNERNFGFERDWYAGFWGILTKNFRYDLNYLVGSGYPLRYNGQSGLGSLRLSLTNKFLSNYGLESGVSIMGGQRISQDARDRSPTVTSNTGEKGVIGTTRAGIDGRYRTPMPSGLLTWTSELSGGKDSPDTVLTQLHQIEYLHFSRRFGVASQFRWFWQDIAHNLQVMPINTPGTTESSILAEVTWYFGNDVSNSNLQWIKLNIERELEKQKGEAGVIYTVQYYHYW